MGLKASLTDFSAGQIFFLLAKFNKTGKVELRSSGEKGEVYFVKGRVTHAVFNSTKGVEALYNLSVFTNGEIEFFPNVRSADVTIQDEVSTLIGEIERRKVELTEIKAKLPPFDSVLKKSPNPPENAVALRKSDWKILVLMDGKKNIKQVVEESGIPALNVYKTIAWMLEKGLIYDPKEAERILKKRLKFINILFEELSSLGIDKKEWVGFVKNSFISSETGKKLKESILFRDTSILFNNKKKCELSKSELEDLFTQLEKELEEKTKSEFGLMLAKTKLESARKKFIETEG